MLFMHRGIPIFTIVDYPVSPWDTFCIHYILIIKNVNTNREKIRIRAKTESFITGCLHCLNR